MAATAIGMVDNFVDVGRDQYSDMLRTMTKNFGVSWCWDGGQKFWLSNKIARYDISCLRKRGSEAQMHSPNVAVLRSHTP